MFLARAALIWAFLSITIPCTQADFSGCGEVSYYESLSGNPQNWSRADLQTLLESTHEGVLPYTSSTREDVWDAMMDLDPGTNNNTVFLVYALKDVPAYPRGTTDTWNREHMWPKSRGVGTSGPDYTDVHHLRPADANVNSARGNKHFSACGIVEQQSQCREPAHIEAALETSADPGSFRPPPSVRGDVARAMFYMDVRYDGNDGGLDLFLTDCPKGENELGYLSQLLKWHAEDPVDSEEIARNNRVCERWQGNRNPFIDHEELASLIFGLPQEDPSDGAGYSCGGSNGDNGGSNGGNGGSNGGNNGPIDGTDGTCSGLSAGDIMVVAMNSDNPDDVALVALSDVPAGIELYMTDNAWTGSSFRTNEGTVKLTIPSGGIQAGSVFGYGDSSLDLSVSWTTESGSFALSTSGDNVMLYCMSDADEIVHVGAFSSKGAWMSPGQEESTYGTGNSALPSGLSSVGAVALEHADNYKYVGITSGTKGQLQGVIGSPSNWSGSNSDRYSVSSSESFFEIKGTCSGLSAGDIMVVAMNSDNPDDVALVALSDVPAGADLFMTDNAWTGSSFRTNEGTVMLTIPSGGIQAGSVFGYGDGLLDYSSGWTIESGSFALSTSGDNVMLYCMSDADEIVHVGAFSSKGAWMSPGQEESTYGTGNSALPSGLSSVGAVALEHADNYKYVGITSGTKGQLQGAIGSPNNWSGSNSDRYSVSSSELSFSVEGVIVQGDPPTSASCQNAEAVPFLCFASFQIFLFASLFV